MTRVLVVNHWHDDNTGDSAITQGILALVRAVHPDAQVEVVGMVEGGDLWREATRLVTRAHPDVATRPSPLPTELRGGRRGGGRARALVDHVVWLARLVPTAVWLRTGRGLPAVTGAVADADLVVLVGGSNLYDDPGVNVASSLARLVTVATPATAAVRSGTRVVLLGHTLGPFPRPVGRRLARHLLDGVDLVVTREQASVDTALSLGARDVEVAPDLAFALEPRRTAAAEAMLDRFPADPSRCLVVSLREHPTAGPQAGQRLVREVAAACRRLLATRVVDGVVCVAHTTGPTPIEDDRPITRALAVELADQPAVMIEHGLPPDELAWAYGRSAAMVAVRLHAALLAANGGTVPLAVSYFTHKTAGTMADLGLAELVTDYASVTADDICRLVPRLQSAQLRTATVQASAERRTALHDRARSWLAVPQAVDPVPVEAT